MAVQTKEKEKSNQNIIRKTHRVQKKYTVKQNELTVTFLWNLHIERYPTE